MWRLRVARLAKLKAVEEDDLEAYLRSLGVFEDVVKKKAKCRFCGTVITLENLEALFPENGKVRFACDKYTCIEKIKNSQRTG